MGFIVHIAPILSEKNYPVNTFFSVAPIGAKIFLQINIDSVNCFCEDDFNMNTTKKQIFQFKTKNFRVVADAVEDFDLDLSFDETGEVRRKLERGVLCSFGVELLTF